MYKYIPVYSEDEVLLGELLRFIHRLEDVNPELGLYESYLAIWDVHSGQHLYIPTEFIDTTQPDKVALWVDMAEVKRDYWGRIPPFIAGRRGKFEELPQPI